MTGKQLFFVTFLKVSLFYPANLLNNRFKLDGIDENDGIFPYESNIISTSGGGGISFEFVPHESTKSLNGVFIRF